MYYGETFARLPEYQFKVGTNSYPPAHTVLQASVTLSTTTPFTLSVGSTNSFEVPSPSVTGLIRIDSGSAHADVTYTGMTAITFTNCLSVSKTTTFGVGTPVYDPRMYVDELPLQQTITFDAVDSQNLGLPKIITAPDAPIISYRWNFGNGQTGFGSTSTTEYVYSTAPPSIQATLTVVDALNRTYATSHPLNIENFTGTFGYSRRYG